MVHSQSARAKHLQSITVVHFQLHAIKLIVMKKNILIPLFVLCIAQAFGQTGWPPIGAKWHYTYRSFCINNYPCWGIEEFIYFEAVSDTVINDTLCTKVMVDYHNYKKEVIPLGSEFFFSEGEQVYNFHHGKFHLLYDFSLEPGDSVMLTLGSNCNLYGKLEANDIEYLPESGIMHHIIKKDSLEIEGEKYLYIDISTPLSMSDYPTYAFFNNRIIKGIGSLEFLTGNLFAPIEIGRYGNLRCYSDTATNYTTDTPCDYLTAAEVLPYNNKVFCYPNPVSNQVFISFTNTENNDVQVEIWDMNGKMVSKAETCNEFVSIETTMLPQGTYIFQVMGNQGLMGTGKFVKTNPRKE